MPEAEKPEPTTSTAAVRTPSNRVIQGALLLFGAVLLGLTVGQDRISFYWTPLILGLWATALGLTGSGLAVVYLWEARPVDIDPAGAYLAGTGIAGIAATVAAGGLVLNVAGGAYGLARTVPAGSGSQ